MATVYSEYSRDKAGNFFGLTAAQLITVVAAGLPVLWALSRQQWPWLFGLAAAWGIISFVTVVPIGGRPALGWLAAMVKFIIGRITGWSRFRARAALGPGSEGDMPDLPGVLHEVAVHDGPPEGPTNRRIALIQHHASRTWAITAAITHPGFAVADSYARHSFGTGLTGLLNALARTELVEEIQFLIRSVPDDGAERDQWLVTNQRVGAPMVAREVNTELAATLARASLRTEAFVSLIVPERRLAREAKEFGGGVSGRARALGLAAAEVETLLRGGMGVRSVTWLTSPEIAAAVRTGFAPDDRASIIDALGAAQGNDGVNATVPWSMAGPSGADFAVRHYSHDAWNSVSATIRLPGKGAVIGALAPVLTPTEPGERRSLMVAYPILSQTMADRQTASAEWKADMGEELRARAGVKTRARDRLLLARTRNLDTQLATGNALVRPYAVAAVTAPKTCRISEYGRRLDASIRQAGFAPLRLDLAQDAGFAAATLPLGLSLLHSES